jgi:diguanylate cyclase (GGDEF)-like protein/PAS domain S-box-containing protein
VLGGAAVVPGTAPWVNAQPHERQACERAWKQSRESSAPFVVEFRIGTPNGETLWVQVATQPIREGNNITGYVGTAIDCTTAVEQRRLSDQLVGLLDASGDAIVVFDRVGTMTFCNDIARTMLGLEEHSESGNDIAARTFMQAVRDQLPRDVISPDAGGTPQGRWEGEVAFRSPEGLSSILAVVVQAVRTREGVLDHWSAIARDITEERNQQRELGRLATHDALTGLPNRVLFLRKTAEAIERSRTTKNHVTVLFIDLDKLKHVNDTIGHVVGDQLIVSIAKRLMAATRPSDLVARIGGDEFVVLCEGLLDEHVAMDVAERIRNSITGPLVLQGVEIDSGASVGVAMSTSEQLSHETPEDLAVTLLRCADTAMYRAKQRGRGRSELYSDDMHRAARERVVLAGQLEQALAADQFFVMYQPIEHAQARQTVAFEALLRWAHPTRGELSPADFLELADESGLIGPIGDWILGAAGTSLRSWIDSGLVNKQTALHVNATRRQLADTTFVDRTITILREVGLDCAQLVVETSEASLVDNNPAILRSITALKRHGVRIAVDDFGAGYSSLSALRAFPADCLKLDGTVVRDVGRSDGGDDPIVRSLIQLAHSLDLTVIAEWVSTDDQLQRLKVLGCDQLQGNLVCKPLTTEQVAQRYQAGIGPVPAK